MNIETKGNIFIVEFDSPSGNAFNRTFLNHLNKTLDTLENSTGPKAVIFIGKDKMFSNGLDLNWISQISPEERNNFFADLWKFLARLMIFPIPTISAINGHAFGVGLFFALACDYRIMRNDRGFLCFPEANLGLPLATFKEVALAKLTPNALRTGVLTGKRWTAEEALKAGMIDEITTEKDLLSKAIELATALAPKGENRTNFTALKLDLYEYYYQRLINPPSFPSPKL